MDSELLMVMGVMGAGLAAVAGVIVAGIAANRTPNIDDLPDDGDVCVACGSTDVVHPAEGVYVCICGYEGGPGMAAYQWQLKTERIAAMPADKREALAASVAEDARLQLTAARGSYEHAKHCFVEGDSIVAIGKSQAARKTELFDQVRAALPQATQHLLEAIAHVETARHIRHGKGRMSDWYDKLSGSRESAFTVTGMQASAALRAELGEVEDVLRGLEAQLG